MKKCSGIRNFALVSHGGAGKTSLAEAMLFNSKTVDRLGRVDEGNTALDYSEDEKARKISINLAVASFEWNGVLCNLVDTPGYADFIGDVVSAIRAVDCAVVLLDASAGVEVGTERVWELSSKQSLPKLIFVNKLKKENGDYFKCYEQAKKSFGNKVIPLQIPLGSETGFKAIVDLIRAKAYEYNDGRKETEIPEDFKPKVEEFRKVLIESVAEKDDQLLEKYLNGEILSEEEIISGIKLGLVKNELTPLLCGDAYYNIGIDLLLEAILTYLPPPEDVHKMEGEIFSSFVFKTISEPHVGELAYIRIFSGTLEPGVEVLNSKKGVIEKINQIYILKGKERVEVKNLPTGSIGVLVKLKDTKTGDTLSDKNYKTVFPAIDFPPPSTSIAIIPKSKGDEEKVSVGLSKLSEEDPTFKSEYDPELKQTLVLGLGELHLEIILAKLKSKFGVSVDTAKPKIPYRETVRKSVKVQGKYKRQSGGRGQYGDTWIKLEPLPRGAGFEFVKKIVGGAIPSKFIPAVEKGIREAANEGVLAGYPVVNVRATLYDGTFHPVDSSDIAFKIAGSMAFRKGQEQSGSILLEPVMEVEVIVPDEYMGQTIGDLNSRRGRIQSMDQAGKLRKIRAYVPQSEMYKYSTQLRSMTQDRGSFSQKFAYYEQVPKEITERVVAESKKEKES